MSKNKRGGGADQMYADYSGIYGSSFAKNPTIAQVTLMERMYMRILTELAVNRFKWINLPNSVDPRFMEMTLFYTALSVFYFDLRYDKFFALRGGGTNWNNMVDNPVGFSVVGSNFIGINLSATKDTEQGRKAIPIWANYMRIPDLDIVMTYARKFANLDRTIEINADNARRSKFIISSENQQLSMVNINNQIDQGDNGIRVKGNIGDLEFVKAVDMEIDPNSHEKLHILKVRLWNECMGLLGINNANQDKKERLVASEVSANDDQTDMMRFVSLNARKMAVKQINEYYGLNIDVVYHTDFEEKRQQLFEAALAVSVENATNNDSNVNEEENV